MNVHQIQLVNCNPTIICWILKSDDILANNLKVSVPNNWTEFGEDIFKFFLDTIREHPDSQKWLSYLPIDIKTNTLIGSCGFKGSPENGIVEIGYEVCKTFRNQGYATEIAKQLIDIAFKDENVTTIMAHTIAKNNASTSVLKKCGFKFVKKTFDEEDGNVYQWQLINKLK